MRKRELGRLVLRVTKVPGMIDLNGTNAFMTGRRTAIRKKVYCTFEGSAEATRRQAGQRIIRNLNIRSDACTQCVKCRPHLKCVTGYLPLGGRRSHGRFPFRLRTLATTEDRSDSVHRDPARRNFLARTCRIRRHARPVANRSRYDGLDGRTRAPPRSLLYVGWLRRRHRRHWCRCIWVVVLFTGSLVEGLQEELREPRFVSESSVSFYVYFRPSSLWNGQQRTRGTLMRETLLSVSTDCLSFASPSFDDRTRCRKAVLHADLLASVPSHVYFLKAKPDWWERWWRWRQAGERIPQGKKIEDRIRFASGERRLWCSLYSIVT